MTSEVQLLLVRILGAVTIAAVVALSYGPLKGTGAEAPLGVLVGTLLGWLGIKSPIKALRADDEKES